MGRSDLSSTSHIDMEALSSIFDEAASRIGIDGSFASALKVCRAHSVDAAVNIYGLYKRVTEGPCNVRMPRTVNQFERILFFSWRTLGDMSSTTAKRLFIKSVKHLLPDWDVTIPVPIVDPSPDTHKGDVESATTVVVKDSESYCLESAGLGSIFSYDVWIPSSVRGKRPKPRSQHGCAIVENKMYIFGGKCRDDNLNDLQALDLRSFKWSEIKTKGMPAMSAPHSLIAWNNKLLFVGCLEKEKDISVIEFDTQRRTWRCMETYGSPPTCRQGLSVTLVGEMLIIYGGEDSDGKCPLENLNMLNLNTLKWDNCVDICQDVSSSPSPRSFHIAASYQNQYFYIFGGKCESLFLNDLHILDLHKRQWFKPDMQGERPCPRAFHAGAAIEQYWFTVGGCDGDMDRVPETSLFNMETKRWAVVTPDERDTPALTCLGMTLASHVYKGKDFLLTFGGYNSSSYYNMINVLKSSHRDVHKSSHETDLQARVIKESKKAVEEIVSEAALDVWMKTIWQYPMKFEELEDKQWMSIDGETDVSESSHCSTDCANENPESSHCSTDCANENPPTVRAIRSVFENPTAKDLSKDPKSVLRGSGKLGSRAAVSELCSFYESMRLSSVPKLVKGL